MTSTKPKPSKETLPAKIQFLSPAKKEFDSFEKLAQFSLDLHCPYWRKSPENDKTRSYFSPPLFKFQLDDRSDRDFEEAKNALKENLDDLLVSKRLSDMAEHKFHCAIDRLAQDETMPSFLVFRGFEYGQN